MTVMNDDSTIHQQHLFATPVTFTCQARSNHDHGRAVPLAPRPSATTLLPEALSSGPQFPCLDTLPPRARDADFRTTRSSRLRQGQEGDNGSSKNKNRRGRPRSEHSRNCSDKHRRIRTLSPPPIIRL